MSKTKFALMALLLILGLTSGKIVNVGETVPVGGTTTPPPEPEPEPEPDPKGAESEGLGGISITNEEGESVNLGSGEASSEPETYKSDSPADTSSEAAPICTSAFVLLSMAGIAFVRLD